MLGNGPSLLYFAPEIAIVAGILALVALGLPRVRTSPRVSALVVLAACAGGMLAVSLTADAIPHGLFGGLLARDGFADYFKYLPLAATAIVTLMALPSRQGPEFHALLLSTALAVSLMGAATDLLTAYLGLEFASITSYLLAAFTPNSRRSAEASLKYVIYGGVASGAMLYGMSLLYGVAASTGFAAVAHAAYSAPPHAVGAALVLVFAGFGYKIAAVPFHNWCPDVYEGAPTPVTAFLSVVPKAGGFALLLRFLSSFPAHATATALLLIVAVATMTLGNLGALAQQNIKRLLAYSSIAHAGYMLLGVAVATPAGQSAVLFYLGVYLFMNLAVFAVAAAVAQHSGHETVAAYTGLGYRMPLCALVMAIALCALTGLPPTGGFIGKYYLFAALIERAQAGAGHGAIYYAAALIAVFNAVVSLYYYARILRAMYLHGEGVILDRAMPLPATIRPLPRNHRAALLALAFPILALGIYWTPLRALVNQALSLWFIAVG